MRRRVTLVTVPLLLLAACTGSGSPSTKVEGTQVTSPAVVPAPRTTGPTTGPTTSTASVCGFRAHPPATYAHVIWVWMENHSYDEVVHSMPYLNDVGKHCGRAANYHAIGHPSLPNYIAATSGGTHGIATDCEPTSCPVRSARSLFGQLTRHGKTWKGYAESMPTRCTRVTSGQYAARHNPAVYYRDVWKSCSRHDVPLTSTTHGLRHDLAAGQLPSFAFVTPNICHDMHDCDIATGDRWLSRWLPRIFGSSTWRQGRTALFVTWDEGEGSGCAQTGAVNDSCHVATWVFGPAVPAHTVSSRHFNHYSLLRTTEAMLGLHRFLGAAARASSMRGAFHL